MAAPDRSRTRSTATRPTAPPPILSAEQIQAISRFPDQNPNPVLRVTDDGRLHYANPASAEIVATWAARVGEPLAPAVFAQLRDAADTDKRCEVVVDNRTFALRVVAVRDLRFINVYGTDITAERAIVKFPDQNPHPVFRINPAGRVIYTNLASRPVLEGIGCGLGGDLPEDLLRPLLAAAPGSGRETVEVRSGDRLYSLLAVDVPEFGFINVYGTDITAARELERLHRENERLLLNILPEPIADRLRRGDPIIADRFDDVTLLFADIVDFTQMSSRMQPEELVRALNDVFTVFDRLVDDFELEKVKTIGDAYMVVGGMPEPTDDHTERMADMALALAREVARITTAAKLGVRFRIGLHCGPVVAGVIGTKKFIYDIWGDTVNVASRMESLGVPGRIQVTGAVEERLRGSFRLEPRGLIDVKGKGSMPTWFLTGRAAARSRRPALAASTDEVPQRSRMTAR